MLHVTYGGGGRGTPSRGIPAASVTRCTASSACITAGARRPDAAIAHEILLAVQPVAVDAALVAEREAGQHRDERRHALELECQQAEYNVTLAARRCEAVDPDNRLVATELEARVERRAELTAGLSGSARRECGRARRAPRASPC